MLYLREKLLQNDVFLKIGTVVRRHSGSKVKWYRQLFYFITWSFFDQFWWNCTWRPIFRCQIRICTNFEKKNCTVGQKIDFLRFFRTKMLITLSFYYQFGWNYTWRSSFRCRITICTISQIFYTQWVRKLIFWDFLNKNGHNSAIFLPIWMKTYR